MGLLTALRRTCLEVPIVETTAARRGFHLDGPAVAHLERIGAEFLAGYHAALEASAAGDLAARIRATVDAAFRGFAFEGAGMACALTDHLRLTQRRFPALLAAADDYRYLVHVGAGWAWARLPWTRHRIEHARSALDPVLGWLAVDGYGFHEGYFDPARAIRRQLVPRGVTGYARRAFDQGVGRSLWFVGGADPDVIARSVEAFAAERRPDLWSGVGLACGYAGGVGPAAIERLRVCAGGQAASLALGCAFACEARRRGRNLGAATELAARLLCGLDALQAADIARDAAAGALAQGETPAYERWRQRTASRIAAAPEALLREETV